MEWRGGECPVDPSTTVRITDRAGSEETGRAGGFDWVVLGDSGDIVSYEVIGKLTNPKDAAGDSKVPLWILSPVASAHWALAQFAGLLKYGAWNWRAAGVRNSTYISAMRRHIDAYESGEDFDPVDLTHHLGNIMACSAIILDAEAAGKLTDDRPPVVDVRPTYAFVERVMVTLKAKYAALNPKHWSIKDRV